MFVVALTGGLVLGVLCAAFLVARVRLRLNFAAVALIVTVIILISLPIPLELSVGLSAGLFLGFMVVLIREPGAGSRTSVE
jgi:hypothetical protein